VQFFQLFRLVSIHNALIDGLTTDRKEMKLLDKSFGFYTIGGNDPKNQSKNILLYSKNSFTLST